MPKNQTCPRCGAKPDSSLAPGGRLACSACGAPLVWDQGQQAWSLDAPGEEAGAGIDVVPTIHISDPTVRPQAGAAAAPGTAGAPGGSRSGPRPSAGASGKGSSGKGAAGGVPDPEMGIRTNIIADPSLSRTTPTPGKVSGSAAPPTGSSAEGAQKDERLIGKVIGDCEILEWIGRGGMGAVYKARQVSLDRPVAFKVIGEAIQRDESLIRRFEREAKTIAKFNSSRIVQVYGVGFDQGIHFIMMEYIPGGDLKGRTRKLGKIPPDEALLYIRQSAEGLLAAERQKIIHRDLKPENLMLDSNGEVKITDFGLAKPMQTDFTLTQMGDYLGTPIYMSPEQAQGLPLDHRSDMYSLGATFFYLVTGSPPYTCGTIYEILRKKTEFESLDPEVLAKDSRIPEAPRRIICRMTAQKPADRYASFKDLIEEIDGSLQGRAPRAARRPFPWARVAVLAAVLAVIAGSATVGRPYVDRLIHWIFGGGDPFPRRTAPFDPAVQGILQEAALLPDRLKKEVPGLAFLDSARKVQKDLMLFSPGSQKELKITADVIQQAKLAIASQYSAQAKDLRERLQRGASIAILKEVRGLEKEVLELPKDDPEFQKDLESTQGDLAVLGQDCFGRLESGWETSFGALKGQLREGAGGAAPERAKDLAKDLADAAVLGGGIEFQRKIEKLGKDLEVLVRQIGMSRDMQEGLSRLQKPAAVMPLKDLPAYAKSLRDVLAPPADAGEDLLAWIGAEEAKRAGEVRMEAERTSAEHLAKTREEEARFRKSETAGASDFPERVEALAEATKNYLAAFPAARESWEKAVPPKDVKDFQALVRELGQQKMGLEDIQKGLAAVQGLFPPAAQAATWGAALEGKITSGIQNVRGKLEALKKGSNGSASPEAVQAEESLGRLEGDLGRWKGYTQGLQEAEAKIASRELKAAGEAVRRIRNLKIDDPRLEKVGGAVTALETAFEALFTGLDLSKAQGAFEEARGFLEGAGLSSSAAWPAECLKRLADLRRIVDGRMAPVPGGRVTVREGAAPKPVEGFFIDRYEVSVGEFRKFLQEMKAIKDFAAVKTLWPSPEAFERGRRDPPYFAEESDLSEKWPIEDVTCFQALAFVRSRGKDLFTVEEWFAAKGRIEGGELRKLPGLLTDMNRAGHPVVVDQGGVALSYNKAGQSVHHLAGNAAEWTRPEKGARSAPLMGGSYRDTDERYCSGERTIAMDLGESRRCCGFRGVLRPREFFGALATN